ncbi:unnamed protein product, partial [Brenthis ino]
MENIMTINYLYMFYILYAILYTQLNAEKRQRRYLLFTPSTQWGVFVTVSIPLPHPETLVSVAWFFEANYYNVANASYFEPLLGDVEIGSVRRHRSVQDTTHILTRQGAYIFLESMLKKHGYPGRPCLLRAICENSSQFLHNGVLGDLLHLVLTPSSSLEEEIEDCYYEAEYWGLEGKCDYYKHSCPKNPIDSISINIG